MLLCARSQEKYPNVPFMWLEFSCGESEVFLLDAETLQENF